VWLTSPKPSCRLENRAACIQAFPDMLSPKITQLGPGRIIGQHNASTRSLSARVNHSNAAGSNVIMSLIEDTQKESGVAEVSLQALMLPPSSSSILLQSHHRP
jgi:hypothetical protein